MKTKRKVIATAIILELICCSRILCLWKYGWTGLYTLLQIFYTVIAMVLVFTIVSVIIDRCQDGWMRREIDERAYEVSKLNRKLQKYNSEWIQDGNAYTRRKDPDWQEDKNMIKTYLIRFRNIKPTKSTVEACEWSYWLGYHRATLQYKQAKAAEEKLIHDEIEEIKDEQMTKECLEYINEIYSKEQEQIETTFYPTGNLEEDIKSLLKMGVQGKDIAEVLHTSPAKVSRVKKKIA